MGGVTAHTPLVSQKGSAGADAGRRFASINKLINATTNRSQIQMDIMMI